MNRHILRIVAALLVSPVMFAIFFGIGGTNTATASSRPCVVGAVGDIGKTSTSGKPTAALIRRVNPVATLGLGDLAYDDGSDDEFENKFMRWFRDLVERNKFFGTPGNHEHHTGNAQGFRNALNNVGRYSHYGVSICGWRILAIDTELNLDTAGRFIMQQRRSYRHMPMSIFTHKPCISNGTSHGNETTPIKPLCVMARKAGVKWIASGHDHSYERFAPVGGLAQFVAGTGGAGLNGFGNYAPHSQKQIREHGVLFFTLRPDGAYGWAFKDLSGRTLDQGVQR